MAITQLTLTKDVWTKVLTNVTYSGQVFINVKPDEEPTAYKVYFVPTGDPAPSVSVDGAVKIEGGFSPSNSVASDFYLMPVDFNGEVVVYT